MPQAAGSGRGGAVPVRHPERDLADDRPITNHLAVAYKNDDYDDMPELRVLQV